MVAGPPSCGLCPTTLGCIEQTQNPLAPSTESPPAQWLLCPPIPIEKPECCLLPVRDSGAPDLMLWLECIIET